MRKILAILFFIVCGFCMAEESPVNQSIELTGIIQKMEGKSKTLVLTILPSHIDDSVKQFLNSETGSVVLRMYNWTGEASVGMTVSCRVHRDKENVVWVDSIRDLNAVGGGLNNEKKPSIHVVLNEASGDLMAERLSTAFGVKVINKSNFTGKVSLDLEVNKITDLSEWLSLATSGKIEISKEVDGIFVLRNPATNLAPP